MSVDVPGQLLKSAESVSDQVMGSVLKTACQTFEVDCSLVFKRDFFQLFNGEVSRLLVNEGMETLKKRLEHFFHRVTS